MACFNINADNFSRFIYVSISSTYFWFQNAPHLGDWQTRCCNKVNVKLNLFNKDSLLCLVKCIDLPKQTISWGECSAVITNSGRYVGISMFLFPNWQLCPNHDHRCFVQSSDSEDEAIYVIIILENFHLKNTYRVFKRK